MLLDFWASWCIPCRRSFPWMTEMARKYRNRGLVIVAVGVDEDRAVADAFLEGRGEGLEIVFDPEGRIAQTYELEAKPSSILFDRQGLPAFRHVGFRPGETVEYEAHIVALLEGRVQGRAAQLTAGAGRRRGVRPWERGVLALEAMQLDA